MSTQVVPVGVIAGIFLRAVDNGASDYWLENIRVNKCANMDYDVASRRFGDPRLYMGEFELEVEAGGVTNTIDQKDLSYALGVMSSVYKPQFDMVMAGDINSDAADLFFQLCVFGAKVYD